MKIHVLPGDSLAKILKETKIKGEAVICRECLIEGEVQAENLDEFWSVRADFIKAAYGENIDNYFIKVAGEFEKLKNLSPDTEVNLWFEYELFCQVNMWFCLDLLEKSKAAIYRVAPIVRTEQEVWQGFGGLNSEDLQICYEQKVRFGKEDILLGATLWSAYQKGDYEKLEQLSETKSACFPYLKEVCKAEIEKNFQPRKVLKEIAESGLTDFDEIFPEFSHRAGIYGFGDAQVKRIMQES